MNVSGEFQQGYNQILPRLEKLSTRCNTLLRGLANSVGARLIEARIKPVESALLKTEKDGLARPFEEMEDLVAATIVVRNEGLIPKVEEAVGKVFTVVRSVPPKTNKPEEFIYDDRHLIIALAQEPAEFDPELQGLLMELQLKTELRAAASTVSRELVYKSRWLQWRRIRWASRIRALVEMVDHLLDELAEDVGDENVAPAEEYPLFASRNEIIAVLVDCLGATALPQDRRRLAVTIEKYLSECRPRVTPESLRAILSNPVHSLIREAVSLSPAQKVFVVLFLEGRLLETPGRPASLVGARRYLITKEMEDLCPDLKAVPEQRRVALSLAT
jgi:ppGpp synthetase/RelA/SpoT-type nucleotidyltranferase